MVKVMLFILTTVNKMNLLKEKKKTKEEMMVTWTRVVEVDRKGI